MQLGCPLRTGRHGHQEKERQPVSQGRPGRIEARAAEGVVAVPQAAQDVGLDPGNLGEGVWKCQMPRRRLADLHARRRSPKPSRPTSVSAIPASSAVVRRLASRSV